MREARFPTSLFLPALVRGVTNSVFPGPVLYHCYPRSRATHGPSDAPARRLEHGPAYYLPDVPDPLCGSVNISTAAPLIKADLGLSNTQLGLTFSAFAYPYLIVCAATGAVGGLASLFAAATSPRHR